MTADLSQAKSLRFKPGSTPSARITLAASRAPELNWQKAPGRALSQRYGFQGQRGALILITPKTLSAVFRFLPAQPERDVRAPQFYS